MKSSSLVSLFGFFAHAPPHNGSGTKHAPVMLLSKYFNATQSEFAPYKDERQLKTMPA